MGDCTGRRKFMNILKGLGAILAGIIFIVVSHSLMDFILESLGIFTPPSAGFHVTWMIVTAIIYRSVLSVAGGWITAALAPDPPMRYVLIMAAIGLLAGILGAVVTIPMGITQPWYPVALAVTGPICVWLGGKLKTR